MVEHARTHHDSVLVEVLEANTAAIGFCRGCGFVDHDLRIDEASGPPQPILRLTRPDERDR